MFENLEMLRMAGAMASLAGTRQEAVARNIANADTPGYKAVDTPPFAEVYERRDPMRATRPGHLAGGDPGVASATTTTGAGDPNGNTVSLEREMVKAAELRQQHDMALAVYRSATGILRSSIGRG